MKKFFKNNLKTILAVGATAVICISGSVFATLQYQANSVSYTTAKNSNIKNVEEALNDLYRKKTNEKYDLIWENPTISALEPTSINLDLSEYTSVLVMGCYATDFQDYLGYKKINVGSSGILSIQYSSSASTTRKITINNTGIEFGEGHRYNGETGNGCAIPMYIIGIK